MRLALQELKQTKVVQGSRLHYWMLFICDKITTRSKGINQKLHLWLRRLFQKLFKSEFTIQNKVGTFTIRADDSISKSSPYFEHHLQNWLGESNARHGFLDIGANIGFYSLLAVNQYNYQRAWAFEANPATHNLLKQNVANSELTDQIQTFPFGLGDSETKINFIKDSYHTGVSRFVTSVPELKDHETLTEIPVRTFDNVAREQNINLGTISFIKIDVEGFEYQVLKGMHGTLSQINPDTLLFIEIWDNSDLCQKTWDLLNKLGFVLYKEKRENKLFKKY